MHKAHKNIPNIELQHLKTFITLAQLGNFSQTGERVGLSQSAVSRHIRALEDALGLRLLDRLGRRAVLTSAGQALRSRLEIVMREVELLPRLLQDLAEGVRGEVRIGAAVTAANATLPPLLGEYRRRYPDVELTLQPGRSTGLLDSLGRGEVDLAVVTSEDLPPRVTILAEIPDEVVLVGPRSHPLAGRRLKADGLAGASFIQREPASDTRLLVDRWFQAEGVKLRTVMEVG